MEVKSNNEVLKNSIILDDISTLKELIQKNKKIFSDNQSVAVLINEEFKNSDYKLKSDDVISLYTFESDEGKEIFWHSSAHLLAEAIQFYYPEAKFGIGPAIDNGFYYDIDFGQNMSFSEEETKKIEDKMLELSKKELEFSRKEVSKEEALNYFSSKNELYKLDLINDLDGQTITLYSQGSFVDLCRGPHLPHTGLIKAVKILKTSGAYWRGDENNKQLTRIYATAFPDKQSLKDYLQLLEEAKQRDHNKIGRELSYFITVDYIRQGLPILLPKGAKVMQLLQRWVEDIEEKNGYLLTKTPYMAKSDLYKISGHWYHYKDKMFVLGEEKEETAMALRPMTCPFQFQVYLSKQRSYRDLPMRLNETSTLFRNEASGEMHGLIRVRQFTISEGHIICLPSQLEKEFEGCVTLAKYFITTLGLADDVSYRFSKWDSQNKDKYIGTEEMWENVQNRMREILNGIGIVYEEADGEAAFYGPKLDIQTKNVYGKEDTLITIQIDFQLAEKFDMEYVDDDGSKKSPYIIHRTSIGCYERTLAMLLEKYAGAFPFWLAPTQIRLINISDAQLDYTNNVSEKLQQHSIRVEADTRNETIGKKLREGRLQKIPYLVIIGDKEVETNTLTVRNRDTGNQASIPVDEFVERILKERKAFTLKLSADIN